VRARRLLAIVMLAAAAIRPSAAQPAALRGRVVDDDTGAPIRNARVAVERDTDTGATIRNVPVAVERDTETAARVLTDGEGRFSLPASAEAHALHASKAGYADAHAPAAGDVDIRLARGGAIAGRILDPFGEPMPLVQVVAERVVQTAGRTEFRRFGAAETDDTGAYRISALPAGEFVVGLGGPRVMLGNTTATPAPLAAGSRPLRSYFPRAPFSALAQRIPVRAGETVEGINFTSDAPPVFAGVFTPAAEARAARGAVIRGRVVRPDGLPVRHARVQLSSAEYLFSPYATIADGDGRYEFGDLRAGGYRIAATDTGFRTVEFGQRGGADHGEPIAVAAGAAVDDVDVTIPRGRAISGRILDEYGDPIENANVRVDRIAASRGRARLTSVSGIASRQTDDRGRFRIFGLLPGRYVVSAVVGELVPGWETADLPGYVRTYYPGVTAAGAAQLVDVNDDGEPLNTEFALTRGRAGRITGRALRGSGAPFDGSVWLLESARSGAIATAPRRQPAHGDGTFEFDHLAPGEYIVQAATSRESYEVEGEFGAAFVQVDGDDASVVVRMSAGSSVAGRVTFDHEPPAPAAAGAGITVTAHAADVDLRSIADNPVANATVSDDWTWQIAGLNGPRRLTVTGLPQGWSLERILVNGLEVTDQPLPFGAADQSLQDVEIVIADRGASLSGRVAAAGDRTLPGASVVAFATDRARWYDGTRFVQLAGTVRGTFGFQALPAGDYYVAAIDKSATALLEDRIDDPGFLESLVEGAARVTLRAGERATVTVRAR
jgi:protocatechuate 3,4-dioxygenase beta subunit